MNFVTDVIDVRPRSDIALIELTQGGERYEWTFGRISDAAASLGREMLRRGVGREDVVMTLIGNRAEWVITMLACFRIGAVVLPCTEQSRSKDLKLRQDVVSPRLVIADHRNRDAIEGAEPNCPILFLPDPAIFDGEPCDPVDLAPTDPCLMTFTSGTTGLPKAVVHGQRYLSGQHLQAEHWLGVRAGDLVWCTAASGWSKSARNAFVAPWLCGAAALVHDARFDPGERLEIVRREKVDILCMAPTEYRVIASRTDIGELGCLRSLVAAGEALDSQVMEVWHEATGIWIRDGYGQSETGQITGVRPDGPVRPGSMGKPLPGINAWISGGELVVEPASVPTFFLNYSGDPLKSAASEWRTGDMVREDAEGFLYFESRADDIIVSSGYRIGPFEVESALCSHPAVAEAAVVAHPDPERGSIVRALVVLNGGYSGTDELSGEIKTHVKDQTAPYKYPRIIEFVDALPRTASGKVQRALLR